MCHSVSVYHVLTVCSTDTFLQSTLYSKQRSLASREDLGADRAAEAAHANSEEVATKIHAPKM